MGRLPIPRFSPENPYWSPGIQSIKPEYRPRLHAQDFLYATSWEMRSRDIHGACCVRLAMLKSFPNWIEAATAATLKRQEIRNEKVS